MSIPIFHFIPFPALLPGNYKFIFCICNYFFSGKFTCSLFFFFFLYLSFCILTYFTQYDNL